jgi:hypothetical protein
MATGVWMRHGARLRVRLNKPTSWKILFVGEHEKQTLLHFPVAQYPVQLLLRFIYSFSILTVHHEN